MPKSVYIAVAWWLSASMGHGTDCNCSGWFCESCVGKLKRPFVPPPPPFSVSSAIKQSFRLSGCWLVHSACLVSHVGAMQVYKPHTLSGQCLVGHSFGLLPPPPTFHGQFPSREKKNCDFFVSFLICRKHFSRVFSSVWRRSGAVH